MSWETRKLSECCVSITDGDHLPPPKAETGIPFVTIANIADNQFDYSDTMFVPEEYYDKLDSKRKASVGDVLYSVVGSFGIPVLIKEQKAFVFQRHIAILRPNPEVILSEFLYYTMLSDDFYKKADQVALGAAQRTVSLTSLRNMEIVVPPIDEQKKIVNKVRVFDLLIDNNHQQISLIEEAAQRLYKEWFICMRFPGHENVSFLDGKPSSWREKELSEVFDYVRGKSYTSKELSDNDGTLMVNLKNIRSFGGYKRNAEKRFIGQFKEAQSLTAGDLVMGVTDMTQERRLVGHVAIIPDFGEPATFSMDLIKLLPKCVTKNFLYATMFFGGFSKKISPLANGTNVLHLKPESMMNLKMLIPDEQTIYRFDSVFEPLRKEIEVLQNQSESAAEARDRLLPKLMNGEIEI